MSTTRGRLNTRPSLCLHYLATRSEWVSAHHQRFTSHNLAARVTVHAAIAVIGSIRTCLKPVVNLCYGTILSAYATFVMVRFPRLDVDGFPIGQVPLLPSAYTPHLTAAAVAHDNARDAGMNVHILFAAAFTFGHFLLPASSNGNCASVGT